MVSDSFEKIYEGSAKSPKRETVGLKVGLIAVASALAGGLAVTWWHRKTLAKLQNPIHYPEIQNIGSSLATEVAMEEEDLE